jgi:hypothetical protein
MGYTRVVIRATLRHVTLLAPNLLYSYNRYMILFFSLLSLY